MAFLGCSPYVIESESAYGTTTDRFVLRGSKAIPYKTALTHAVEACRKVGLGVDQSATRERDGKVTCGRGGFKLELTFQTEGDTVKDAVLIVSGPPGRNRLFGEYRRSLREKLLGFTSGSLPEYPKQVVQHIDLNDHMGVEQAVNTVLAVCRDLGMEVGTVQRPSDEQIKNRQVPKVPCSKPPHKIDALLVPTKDGTSIESVAFSMETPRSREPQLKELWLEYRKAFRKRGLVRHEEEGRDIFNGKGACHTCHGQDGYPDRASTGMQLSPKPSNLRDLRSLKRWDSLDVLVAISDGIPGTGMPAYADRLTKEEISAVWKYVLEIQEQE